MHRGRAPWSWCSFHLPFHLPFHFHIRFCRRFEFRTRAPVPRVPCPRACSPLLSQSSPSTIHRLSQLSQLSRACASASRTTVSVFIPRDCRRRPLLLSFSRAGLPASNPNPNPSPSPAGPRPRPALEPHFEPRGLSTQALLRLLYLSFLSSKVATPRTSNKDKDLTEVDGTDSVIRRG